MKNVSRKSILIKISSDWFRRLCFPFKFMLFSVLYSSHLFLLFSVISLCHFCSFFSVQTDYVPCLNMVVVVSPFFIIIDFCETKIEFNGLVFHFVLFVLIGWHRHSSRIHRLFGVVSRGCRRVAKFNRRVIFHGKGKGSNRV